MHLTNVALDLILKSMLNHPPTDAALDALGDPTRRAIVERLSIGPASVGELAEPLRISRSAVLQHLRVLERSRLATSRKVGRVRICELDPAGLRTAQAWIDARRTLWERRLDRLGKLLDEEGRRS